MCQPLGAGPGAAVDSGDSGWAGSTAVATGAGVGAATGAFKNSNVQRGFRTLDLMAEMPQHQAPGKL